MDHQRIVDAHAHLGYCQVGEISVTEDELIDGMDRNGIHTALVQPMPGARNSAADHNNIADLSETHPSRVFGIVSLHPYRPRDEYVAEAERCIKELGFVGIKMHPNVYPVNPLGSAGTLIVETAERLDVPLMMHTGPGLPWAAPGMAVAIAREHPKLKVVLAHAGWGLFTLEAMVVAEAYANVFLETSWTTSLHLRLLLDRLGPDRLMFGADVPINQPTELAKYRSLDLTTPELESVLGGTARRIFRLSDKR